MWRVYFTEKRAWSVYLWTSVKRDLPPEMYVTRDFFFSFSENLKICLKSCIQEERFEFLPLIYMTRDFFLFVRETGSGNYSPLDLLLRSYQYWVGCMDRDYVLLSICFFS